MEILRQRYSSTTRMQSIENDVSLLNINNFLLRSVHEGEALHKLARKIEDLVPQCLPGRILEEDQK